MVADSLTYTYTNVGFVGLILVDSIHLLADTEALADLIMITWSASFTFLKLQRYWRPNESIFIARFEE